MKLDDLLHPIANIYEGLTQCIRFTIDTFGQCGGLHNTQIYRVLS